MPSSRLARLAAALLASAALAAGCGGTSSGTTADTASPDGDTLSAPDATEDTDGSDVAATDTGADEVQADVDDVQADAGGDTADAPCPTDVTPGDGVVVTDRGAVRGFTQDGVTRFLGIPFAAPPVGPLRWRPPEAHACWAGVRDADAWPAPCVQKDFQLGQSEAPVIGSEDCLYLNVWTPTAAATPRPVLVFLHGGGNVSGATATEAFNLPLYDGARLAGAADAVVVTLEYRLGPLGFLALPALSDRAASGTSGNYGLLDQLFGLAWVQRNVAAFGGDPDRVLLFGESAGALDAQTATAAALPTSPPATPPQSAVAGYPVSNFGPAVRRHESTALMRSIRMTAHSA